MAVIEELNNKWSEDSQRLIISSSYFAKNTLFYAHEIGFFKTFPSYFAARSNLDSYLIVLTLNGKGLLQYQSNEIILHENNIFFIDCMKPHKYSCISENWDFLWIHINGATTSGYYSQFVENNPNNVLFLSDKNKAESLLRKLLKINQTPSKLNEIYSSQLISELLTELLLQNFKSYTQPQQYPDFLKKVLDDIDKNYTEPLRLNELALKYNIDMYHLSKAFHNYIGINLKEYILNRRITKAKKLLTYSNLSVMQISSSVGFESTSYFIALFKSKEGLTPLKYRNMWKP